MVKKTKVLVSFDPDLLARIDEMADKLNMERCDFIAAFMEITLDSEKPLIHFGKFLGDLKAAAIWPKAYQVREKRV